LNADPTPSREKAAMNLTPDPSEDKDEGPRRTVAPLSVARVLQIIETLSTEDGPVGLARLSRALGVPKSSLVSLLRGLSDMNYVIAANGAFRLGPRSFELGSALVRAVQRIHVSDAIRDGMRELNVQTGETVLYAVISGEDGLSMTYGDIIETRQPVRVAVTIGEHRPLYCTAGGRMLLAARSDAEVLAYLARAKPEKLTENTETDPARLLKAVQDARRDEVAQVSDELIVGVCGIASPVRDVSGAMRGVLIVSTPTTRIADGDNRLAELTRESARAISRSLGYRGLDGR
jgi:DNA-binding IclR family transcriptional regulator